MERVTIRDLYCPVPSRINRHVSEAEDYALEWAREVGLMPDSDIYGIGKAHIGYLASYAHPDVSWEALKIAVAWLDWLMVYDDTMFDKRVNVNKLNYDRIDRFHQSVLAILRGVAHPGEDEPLYSGMRELRRAIIRLAPAWDMGSFIRGFRHYLQANLWEATNMWQAEPPRVPTYMNMRRHTGCLFPTYELSAMLAGIELKPEVRDHVAVRQLEIMANNYTCWLNDVFSFEREHVDGHVNSLVMALQHSYQSSFQLAVDRASEACRTEAEAYLELKARLPALGLGEDRELARYLGVLEAWMRALYDWHHMTGRYEVPA